MIRAFLIMTASIALAASLAQAPQGLAIFHGKINERTMK